jgi:BirA family transcriptional regulator, biotin operon repressor / biotin---[acetyl-CoA-carboxylase] ligase
MPFDLARVQSFLPGRRIEWFASIDSTMNAAADLARGGCPSGTIAGAEEQTAGVGRHGRSWHSEPGEGLYASFVLRWDLPAEKLPLVMLALGLATHRAIEQIAGLAPDLRWPNDVLLDGKKCAGILARAENQAIIAGIGINVNHESFPVEISDLATSLRLAGASVKREDLLVGLARAIDDVGDILMDQGADAILRAFTHASSYVSGRRVRVDQDGVMLEGTTYGLDSAGFLRLQQDNGTVTTILAGGVRPA